MAIRICYNLPKDSSILDCFEKAGELTIMDRIAKRRSNFLRHNCRNRTIAYSETYKTARGRKLRIRQNFHYKNKRPHTPLARYLHTHKPYTFFSYLLPSKVPRPKLIHRNQLHHNLLSTDPDIQYMAKMDLAAHYRDVEKEDNETNNGFTYFTPDEMGRRI